MPPFSGKRLFVAFICLAVTLAICAAYGISAQRHGVPPVALSAFVLVVQLVGIGVTVGLVLGRNWGLAAASLLFFLQAMSI